ncbi:MFS transporter [Caballeronia sordidicola]|uniref:MFS transporter n=1 Tax=Caballeronia sordidicola TaxID=196367 RepID=A0A158H4W3_CABSO|nr:DUF2946 domain-containing protein [Caballeronia sordidicola]SAL39187.1 MFS transporter [Caballeronia sordidicola]
MNRTSRNRFVAWLGIAAMWLAIVAPVISQTLVSHEARFNLIAALCSVDTPRHTQSASPVPDEHAGHHMAGDTFDACSYCGLLAHNVPLASAPPAALARVERVTRLAAEPIVRAVHVKSFNAASPRAPPIVS